MTALVWHPRLECWLPAGGHVETDETAAQCGIRQALLARLTANTDTDQLEKAHRGQDDG
jgi:hypothetical protein